MERLALDSDLLCFACGLPLIGSRQAECGDRACKLCYDSWAAGASKTVVCNKCSQEVNISELFRDKAVERDLKRVSFPCINLHCTWKGSNHDYRDHLTSCAYAEMKCPNGCGAEFIQAAKEDHLITCPAKPVLCEWCQEMVPRNRISEHLKQSCEGVRIACSAGCGEHMLRRELPIHLRTACKKRKRPCRFEALNCDFKGNVDELAQHMREAVEYHLELVREALQETSMIKGTSAATTAVAVPTTTMATTQDIQRKFNSTDRHLVTLHQELTRFADDYNKKLAPLSDGLIKMEASLRSFHESFSELVLLVQTLQATSYNGEFIWKIPEVKRRREEARTGKTISLYSAPFYTCRFGYKLCLRLYMDGDGSGKRECLSFFLTIMRGEYDALQSWPFQQGVTLILLDQDKQNDIVQCFRPEPSSSSFWRPKADMNVASGCPRFADLSVLNNPCYTRNDTMFLKCIVDKAGLQSP